jgi:hypothetical protein
MTHCIDIFLAASRAVAGGVSMRPRSENDKEYFPQDWFLDRLREVGVPFEQQGRNAYPDFWVGKEEEAPPVEGYEVKSLSFAGGRPARKDYDSNSSLPSGKKAGRDVFLVFFLYTGSGNDPRPVHSLAVAHMDLVNSDHAVADAHMNIGVGDFGSYADGFIRNRKMYRFPHPFELYPQGLGRCCLLVPAAWTATKPELRRIGQLERRIAEESVVGYTIDLHRQGAPQVRKKKNPDGGRVQLFDVFEGRPV